MLLDFLITLRTYLTMMLDRLDTVIEARMPAVAPVHELPQRALWDQAEARGCATMVEVDAVLSRWTDEGCPAWVTALVRHDEFVRRMTDGVRINTRGGQA